MNSDLFWRALSSPPRRSLLELLRAGPRTTLQLAAHFEMSRPGVMQHLDVLANADLVSSEKRGRQRWYHLNGARLEQELRWWNPPESQPFSEGLVNFKESLEMDQDIAQEIDIAQPPHVVFGGLFERVHAWWPRKFRHNSDSQLELERKLGGQFVERFSGGGALIATVTRLEDPTRLVLTGNFHMPLLHGVADLSLEPSAAGTRLRFTFRGIGDVPDRFATAWTEILASLKRELET